MSQTDPTRPDDIPFLKIFFKSYLVDHFLHKQVTLLNILENYSKLKDEVMQGAGEIDDAQYLLSLRTEIRANLFQAIETLFELIFTLEGRNGVIYNPYIWYHLSTSHWRKNLSKIEAIGNGQVDFLDRIVIANPKTKLKVPFVQYVFYFGCVDISLMPAILNSLQPIKSILIALAKEFSDRDEYNAFKHSLRLFPIIRFFEFYKQGITDPLLKIDLSNSLTVLKKGTDDSMVFQIKPLDTVRDYRMCLLCCNLISNIVRSRRAHFYKGESVSLNTFSEETLPWATESHTKVNPMTIKLSANNETNPQG
jgi:hypothetical protein